MPAHARSWNGSVRPRNEVQRPVFYAIAIIITAYLPIFTLQQVEGKLFRPMAWTVAFALLGALLFSMLIAPALATFLFRKNARQWRNPVMEFLTTRYRAAVTRAVHWRWLTVGVAANFAGGRYLPGFQRSDRLRVSAASRRGRHLGARHSGPQHGADGRRAGHRSGSPGLVLISRSPAGRHAGGTPG